MALTSRHPWNPETLSDQFLSAAANAEKYVLECKIKVARSEVYKALHDEHLAKFHVYNYLHGRSFLATRPGLVSELRSFLKMQQAAPREAFDGEHFLACRRRFISELIQEFDDATDER